MIESGNDSIMADTDDSERTDDRAFGGDAAEHLNDATEHETNEQASEEDGSSPDEPQPSTYPADDDEQPAPTAAPEPVVTTPDDPAA